MGGKITFALEGFRALKESRDMLRLWSRRYAILSKKRIFVHPGLPKTGTTSFQKYCTEHREALLTRGLWYPPHLGVGEIHRHQWLVRALLLDQPKEFYAGIDYLERAWPKQAHTLLLSTEGLSYNHQRFTPSSLGLLSEMIAACRPTCLFVHRDPAKLLPSFYKESLIRDRRADRPEFGSDDTFDMLANRPYNQNLVSRTYMVEQFNRLYGADRVVTLDYTPSIVSDLLTIVLGPAVAGLPPVVTRANPSISDAEAELLRLLNAGHLPDAERRLAVAHFKAAYGGPAVIPAPHPAAPALLARLRGLDCSLVQVSEVLRVHADDVYAARDRLIADLEV
jgi:hypothetical protein